MEEAHKQDVIKFEMAGWGLALNRGGLAIGSPEDNGIHDQSTSMTIESRQYSPYSGVEGQSKCPYYLKLLPLAIQ